MSTSTIDKSVFFFGVATAAAVASSTAAALGGYACIDAVASGKPGATPRAARDAAVAWLGVTVCALVAGLALR